MVCKIQLLFVIQVQATLASLNKGQNVTTPAEYLRKCVDRLILVTLWQSNLSQLIHVELNILVTFKCFYSHFQSTNDVEIFNLKVVQNGSECISGNVEFKIFLGEHALGPPSRGDWPLASPTRAPLS